MFRWMGGAWVDCGCLRGLVVFEWIMGVKMGWLVFGWIVGVWVGWLVFGWIVGGWLKELTEETLIITL